MRDLRSPTLRNRVHRTLWSVSSSNDPMSQLRHDTLLLFYAASAMALVVFVTLPLAVFEMLACN
jgi:hypothetical protein